MNDFCVLDCTLRDGGYLNNWNFDSNFVKDYYKSVCDAGGIDYLEIGLLYPENKDRGEFHSVQNSQFFNDIKNDGSGIKLVAMIDYGKSEFPLGHSKDTGIEMIRVTSHQKDIYDALKYCYKIKENHDYKISIQIMDFPKYSLEKLKDISNLISKDGMIDVTYLADSYGSASPISVSDAVSILKSDELDVGYHAHDNIHMALHNTVVAIDNGADIVDATLCGMGRGAGNLKLEEILIIVSMFCDLCKVDSILQLIDNHEDYLKSLGIPIQTHLFMSGLFGCHPNDVMNMRKDNKSFLDIWNILKEKKGEKK